MFTFPCCSSLDACLFANLKGSQGNVAELFDLKDSLRLLQGFARLAFTRELVYYELNFICRKLRSTQPSTPALTSLRSSSIKQCRMDFAGRSQKSTRGKIDCREAIDAMYKKALLRLIKSNRCIWKHKLI